MMGLGDEIMAAGRAKAMAAAHGKPVAIVDRDGVPRTHEVWEGNPSIDPKSDLKLTDGVGCRGYMLRWEGSTSVFDMSYCNRDHPGEIFIPDWARDWAAENIPRDCIIVEPIVRRPSSPGKDWGFDRFNAVADRLAVNHELIQLGEDGGRQMLSAAQWIKTDHFWKAAAAIERARLVICPEGGSHHMAGALGVPAVVIYGGFTHPQLTGYDGHTCLYVDGPESPCGRFQHCTHCDEALASITVDQVLKACEAVISISRSGFNP